jgi:hypothetical protein
LADQVSAAALKQKKLPPESKSPYLAPHSEKSSKKCSCRRPEASAGDKKDARLFRDASFFRHMSKHVAYMTVKSALMPHEHVRFCDSIVALAGFVRAMLIEPKTIDELWAIVRQEKSGWLSKPSFECLTYAVDVLFALKQIEMNQDDGRLTLRASDKSRKIEAGAKAPGSVEIKRTDDKAIS